jgi:dienelactone hydrolase
VAAHAQAQGRPVDIKTPDGVVLKGSYFSPGKPGPGVLLFHQCNMDRGSWNTLAHDLTNVGIHVLSYDYRGFGDTGGKMPPPPSPKLAPGANPRDPIGLAVFPPGDADAALSFLLAQPGVDQTRVAAGGASCGVAEAGDLAIRRPQIVALFLMSGLVSPAASAYIRDRASVAVFGVTAADDFGAAVMRESLKAGTNTQSVFTAYPGEDHGVTLFDKHPELRPTVVQWLQARLLAR